MWINNEEMLNFYCNMQEKQNVSNMLYNRKVEIETNECNIKIYEKRLKELQHQYIGKYKELLVSYYKEELKNLKKYNKEIKKINKKYQELYELM